MQATIYEQRIIAHNGLQVFTATYERQKMNFLNRTSYLLYKIQRFSDNVSASNFKLLSHYHYCYYYKNRKPQILWWQNVSLAAKYKSLSRLIKKTKSLSKNLVNLYKNDTNALPLNWNMFYINLRVHIKINVKYGFKIWSLLASF